MAASCHLIFESPEVRITPGGSRNSNVFPLSSLCRLARNNLATAGSSGIWERRDRFWGGGAMADPPVGALAGLIVLCHHRSIDQDNQVRSPFSAVSAQKLPGGWRPGKRKLPETKDIEAIVRVWMRSFRPPPIHQLAGILPCRRIGREKNKTRLESAIAHTSPSVLRFQPCIMVGLPP